LSESYMYMYGLQKSGHKEDNLLTEIDGQRRLWPGIVNGTHWVQRLYLRKTNHRRFQISSLAFSGVIRNPFFVDPVGLIFIQVGEGDGIFHQIMLPTRYNRYVALTYKLVTETTSPINLTASLSFTPRGGDVA